MSETTLHYLFAHRALPHWFLHDPTNTLDLLSSSQGKAFIQKIYWDLCERIPKAEWDSMVPLDLEAITIHPSEIGGTPCVLIQMPPPERCSEAFMVALCQGEIHCHELFCATLYPKGRRNHYFTLEKSAPGLETQAVFGAWTETGHSHWGYRQAPTIESFVAHLRRITAPGSELPAQL